MARSQYGVVNLAQLRATGYSSGLIAHYVKTGRLERMLPGVYRLTVVPHS